MNLEAVYVYWKYDSFSSIRFNNLMVLGCKAKAIISYPFKDSKRIQEIESLGSWGIADNIQNEEKLLIENRETMDLKEQLKIFGVDLKEFNSKLKIDRSLWK
jgi:hypothetical protein